MTATTLLLRRHLREAEWRRRMLALAAAGCAAFWGGIAWWLL